jgi:energy-coupling factor transport system ATP-binding protein
MALISLENVSYFYEGNGKEKTAAVKNVSVDIEEGDFWGIIGHTGSGKSTLTELMCGLLKPSEGKCTAFGVDLKEIKNAVKTLNGKVGLVFQYPEHQLFEETVLKDVAFGPKNLGCSEEEAYERARWAMHLTNLDEKYESSSPFELSGGQKRRAAIAGVLAMKPEVLILDEPTAGLDPVGRDEMLSMLHDIKKNWCKSIVLVSHSMEDVAKNVDKLLVMNDGEAVLKGGVREVYSHAEELLEIGLDVPQVSRLIARLNSFGWGLDKNILTVEEACEAIYERLRVV